MSSLATLRLLFADTGSGDDARRLERGTFPVAPSSETGAGTSPDTQTIAALRVGDTGAFEQLFREQYLPLRRFARMLVRDDDRASDVVEDVFAWLWEARERLNIQGTLASYLYSAVRHRALNMLRDGRRQSALRMKFARDLAGEISDSAAQQTHEEHERAEADLLVAVRAVIATLPERRRLAITLRWDGGLTNTEIATVLGVAPQSVANLLQRALADLRAALPRDFR